MSSGSARCLLTLHVTAQDKMGAFQKMLIGKKKDNFGESIKHLTISVRRIWCVWNNLTLA